MNRRSAFLTSCCSICCALIACLVLAADAGAGEITRKVGRGESLSAICRDVYGDKELYTVVALYNGKTDPQKIKVGEVLRLPWSGIAILGKGESMSARAKKIWGNPKMYPVLAWANGIYNPAKVSAGTRLLIPVLVPYKLKAGESVSSVAGRFYGDPKQFDPILTASGIDDPSRLPAGASLKVPYIFPKPLKKAEPAPKPVPIPSTDPKRQVALGHLQQAETAFRSGDYGESWTMGSKAAKRLAGKDKARALRLMASCQYAFDKKDEALGDLKAAHELDPGFKPDPAYVNPEMMTLYERASRK
jgi:hypothetical protein